MDSPERLAVSESAVLRSSAQVSVITAIARVAGFARWIALGLAVGTTYLGNTYQTANWIPNIVFDLVAGGVLSAVFVPTFVRELVRGRERAADVASSLANTFLLVSVPLVVVGVVFAAPLMRSLTSGVEDAAIRAQQIDVGARFLYVFLPQIPMYVLAMVFTGVLHAHRRFVIPAAAPLFSSLVVIGAYAWFAVLGRGAEIGSASEAQLWILAGGTTLGVFVLTFCQLPSIIRSGFRWRPVLMWSDADVRRAIRAGVYGVAFFAVTAIGLSLTLVLANRIQGGVVAFRVAYAFYELPKALIGLPVAIALLPTLSERAVRNDELGYVRLVSSGWRAAVFASVPAGIGLFVLGPVLSEAMLGAAPTAAAPELVGATLRGLALGIPAFVLVEPLARSFYARGDTRSPVVLNAVAVAGFALVVLPLTAATTPAGAESLRLIGGSTAAGQWLGTGVGVALLASRLPAWEISADLRAGLVTVARAAVMGAVVWLVVRSLDANAWAASVAGVIAGLVVFVALSARSEDMRRTLSLLRRPDA